MESTTKNMENNNMQVTSYPRMTLKCTCGNQFNINVMRLQYKEAVICLICGAQFPEEVGEKFAKALEELFRTKYELEKRGSKFQFAFIYKSTFKQPPAPLLIEEE